MLSLTLVAVQLAMVQFSPRIVALDPARPPQPVRNRPVLRHLRLLDDRAEEVNGKSSAGGPVPGLSTVVDYALILSAIGDAQVLYVHHTAQSIRVGGLIGLVGDEDAW